MAGSEDSDRVDIYMRVYVSDLLNDTSDLSAEEFGAYTRLLFEAWKRGGELPREPHRLARLATVEADAWTRVWAVIGRFFTLNASGALTQKRLTAELAAARERKARASLGGLAKAEQRRQGVLFETTPPDQPLADAARESAKQPARAAARNPAGSKIQGFRGSEVQGSKGSLAGSGEQSAHARALQAFTAVWAAEYGQPYVVTAADKSNLGRLLRELEDPDAIPWPAIFRRYLDDHDKWLSETQRHSLTWFCTKGNGINKYRTKSRTNGLSDKDIRTGQAVAAFAEGATNGRHR